jgi:hypothetical protein
VKKYLRLFAIIIPYLLLLIFVIIFFNHEKIHLKTIHSYQVLRDSVHSAVIEKNISETNNKQLLFILNDIGKTSTIKIRLNGMPVETKSFAYIYWDSLSGHVYFNPNGLPEISQDSYKLWAYGDTKWEDLGFIDLKSNPLIQRMRDTRNPHYFGVSRESDKDKKLPALENMVVMGDIQNGF